jgi:hypothetical protein
VELTAIVEVEADEEWHVEVDEALEGAEEHQEVDAEGAV